MTRILVPGGVLGLGFDAAALERGVAARPDLIAIDGGSTDSGPYYLGRGVSKYARAAIRDEWSMLLAARERAGVPLLLGSAGTCGTDARVDEMVELTRELLAGTGSSARIATLKSGQSGAALQRALHAGRIRPLDPAAPPLTAERLAACSHVVALAGAEQVGAALQTGADVIIAGRATDTALISALPLLRGDHPGAAWHGAKVGECGALCAATRPLSGVVQIDFDRSGFTVEPLAEGARATPESVLAHMLYENADPFVLVEPGGRLEVGAARHEASGERAVRVSGSRWVPAAEYRVKLEGAVLAGYRCLLLALLRDARYVAESDRWCASVAAECGERAARRLGIGGDEFSIELRQIGRNATLGELETRAAEPLEIGVLGIVTAASETLALEIGQMLNPLLLHHPLGEGEPMPTFAFPFSPAELGPTPAYEFALNHTIELDEPMAAFRLEGPNG